MIDPNYSSMVNGEIRYWTQEEIDARQAEEALPKQLAPLQERLKAILMTLSDDIQAEFGTVAAAVDLALRNGADNVAKIAIQNVTIPAELEPVRTSLLEEFDRV